MAKGLRSIGINKIIPAQIDFTQITSGSAAGPGSFVALSSDGTPVLVDIASYYEASAVGDIEGVTAGNGLTGGGTTGTVTLNIGAGTGISVAADSISTNDSEIVHDNLSGFVSDEHVAHSTVSITAGNGLTGGGTIDATRTIDVGAGTGISVAADSISTNDSEIVHDNLSGFVSDEHVAHSTVSITAGNGLTGGGTIAATRTINVGAGTGITVNADDISFDPDGATLTFLNSSVDQILINDGGVFKRIPPGYIDISSFNNDSGFTSNIGDMTGVNISVGDGLDITQNNTTSGDYSATLSLDLTEVIANPATANAILTSDGDGTLTGETNLTFDGTNLTIANQGKVIFDTVDTYIAANTDNPEDLEIHANQDILLNADGVVECYSALRVQDYISHIGDIDTSIEFTDDKIVIDAGGVEMITITESTQNSVVINEGGGDVDFRVESNAIPYAFWVRGSDGRVGIGTETPRHTLDVPDMGGLILSYVALYNDTTQSKTLTTSFTQIASTDQTAVITFTAPQSGNIELQLSTFVETSDFAWVYFSYDTDTSYTATAGRELLAFQSDESDDVAVNLSWVITGLTAGTSYTYYIYGKYSTSSGTPTAAVKWGGNQTNSSTSTGAKQPLIIRAISLPSTIVQDN